MIAAAPLLVLLAPFFGKAFHADDPLFIWAASHIQTMPTNPYGFTVNWYGTSQPMSDVMKNPPLASYYLAAMAGLLGWSERALHLAFALPALATSMGTYLLARRFSGHPLLATLAGVLTPVFFVSSLTIMCDMLMLAFWVFAIHFWIAGVEARDHRILVLAGLLVALAALAKYFGLALIPLLLVYALVRERRLGWWAVYLLVPVGLLAAYQWTTHRLYGRGLLLDVASYVTTIDPELSRWSIAQAAIGLGFAGGCVASVLFLARQLWSWAVIAVGVVVAGLVALVIASSETLGGIRLPLDGAARGLLAVQFGVWAVVGLGLLILAALDINRRRDADATLLFLWTMGTFVFAAFVNWSTNGRSMLPLVVPAGILIARRLELRARSFRPRSPTIVVPFAALTCLSLAVTWADYRFAETARTGAARIHDTHEPGRRPIWFQGHWGFQFYMERRGAKAVDVKTSRFVPGDLVATPTTNTNTFAMEPTWPVRGVLEIPSSRWIATMSRPAGAGFYADIWGPLPFAFGAIPMERFTLVEVRPRPSPAR